ncbi:pilus assembly protein, PilP [Geobacter sp. OR-1]|nr:pilus assembly protein, PilP [Geobacter sp. OR-1]
MKRVAVSETQIDFAGRKDPFKPYIIQPVTPVRKAGQAKIQNALPIQSFDVNKFKLTGIIVGLKENRALIVDPYRKGYVVKAGMLLGNNNGRITKITGDAVEVLEQFRDDNGILRKRTVRLVLPQKK